MNSVQWLAGWLPAVILPLSTFLQLAKIIKSKSSQNISWLAWFLFGLANIGAYIFSGKYTSVQSILAFLLSAVLDFMIVGFLFYYKSDKF